MTSVLLHPRLVAATGMDPAAVAVEDVAQPIRTRKLGSATLATMIKHGGPLTRERWIDINYLDGPPTPWRASSTNARMVMSASSARRASCCRSPLRRLSENWMTSSAGRCVPNAVARPHSRRLLGAAERVERVGGVPG